MMIKKWQVTLHLALVLAAGLNTSAYLTSMTNTAAAAPQVQFLTGFGGPKISIYRLDRQTLHL